MKRLGALWSSALVIVLASPALADLVIEIPDVPSFELTDPIVSDEPVRIIANGSTDLTLGDITAPELSVDFGEGTVVFDGTLNIGGEVTLNSLDVSSFGIVPSGLTVTNTGENSDQDDLSFFASDDVGVTDIPDFTISTSSGLTLDGAGDNDVPINMPVVAMPPPAVAGTGIEDLSADLGRAQVFTERLFSCPTAEDPAAQRTCAWTSAEGSRTEFTGTGPYDDTTFSFAMGAQAEIADGWFLGGALGVDSSDTTALTSETDSERLRVGLVVKYVEGPLTAGLALAGGLGRSDLTRPTATGTAEADFSTRSISVRADATYTHRMGAVFLQPGLGVSFTHLASDGFTETGAGVANRTVQDTHTQSIGVHPRIRIGGDLILGPYDTRVRPNLTLGLDWQSNPDLDVATSAGTQRLDGDALLGAIAAGLDIFADDDVEIGVAYRGRFGADTRSHGGEVRLRLGL